MRNSPQNWVAAATVAASLLDAAGCKHSEAPMPDCLFCKIIKKELPSTILFEDEETIAFKDIHPKAPTHLLFIPKKHIESVLTLTEETKDVPAMLIWKAKEFAASKGIPGYKLTFHCGREGGQLIDHIHLHLMAEKRI